MSDISRKIEHYINQRRLRDAFAELRTYAATLGDWRITDEIDKVEQSYSMMLRYAATGANDPGREEVYSSIISEIFGIVDKVSRRLAQQKSPTLYFSTVRYDETAGTVSVSDLLDEYRRKLMESSIYSQVVSGSGANPDSPLDKEGLERRIFNKIWISLPLSSGDMEALGAFFEAEEIPGYFKEMLISALLLGLTEYYDERKLLLLLDLYSRSSLQKLSIKALCGALMAMFIHRNRLNTPRFKHRIDILRDTTDWHKDVKMVFLQFIRSRDTEKINRKMQDELLPEMMKLRPDIAKRMKNSDGFADMGSMEENPEWQELLDKSGITDKIKELSKMQEDGGDVFMSTFSSLKAFPFFNEVANWFMPFHTEHSSVVSSLGKDLSAIGTLVNTSPFLCDGDKYSFVFAVSTVPAVQRQMMLSQFDAQNINELELRAASMTTSDIERDNIANKYVQDIYRFFKLFRRRGEFKDPFGRPLNLLQLSLLEEDFADIETLSVVSEFYFNRGYYEDALKVFDILSEKMPPNAQLFQKMGYCCQQSGNIESAIEYYGRSELLNAESLWTLKRMAACYKMLDRPSEALDYYKRIEAKKPDDLSVALNIGHCLLELDRPEEALHYYFKVEFLDEKSTRALRPIAWASFVSGDFDQSRSYYNRILTDSPVASDYLNMGHLYLASGDVKEAINYYGLSIDNDNGDVELFIKNFNSDAKYLVNAGVEKSLLPLVVDAILYARD